MNTYANRLKAAAVMLFLQGMLSGLIVANYATSTQIPSGMVVATGTVVVLGVVTAAGLLHSSPPDVGAECR